MKKEKTLNEKKETFRFWNENTQKWGVSFYRDEDVKQFIKEILDDLIKRQNFLAKEMPPEWQGFFNEIEEIKQIIKQKAGDVVE